MFWLYQARKRFGLCILDFIVTSNHVHLLVLDQGLDEIPSSMQLVASQTAQRFNKRRRRLGAFWQDRYHATAVEADSHLHRCIAYIDLNMVRAGAVTHPSQWLHCGYRQIQCPPMRYRLIDLERLRELCGFQTTATFQLAHRNWIDEAINLGHTQRDARWTEYIAVGSESYVDRIKQEVARVKTGKRLRTHKTAQIIASKP
jgi:putative transposase